ncbi:MAG: DsbA family protein [Gammaproteobacteria bacterium]|nr:DsbA family protein [Gammaproteobacteria bacterium]
MTSYRNLLLASVAILFSACGGGSETDQALDIEPAAETATAPPTEAEIAADSTETVAPAVLEAVEESTGETDTTSSPADEAIVLAKTESPAAQEDAPQWQFSEGQHFTMLTTAQGTSSAPDVIEVAEVFWYGCPHCFNFDPYLKKWAPELPDDARFIRLPVMWNPTNQIHARIFYTAEALNKLDVMHDAIFKEMHVNRKQLTSEDDIREFFARFDVSEEEFNSTFRSFGVESKLKRAKNLTQRYRIQSVPLLVINGKYLTTGPGVKNFDDMLAVADELIERERQ